MSTTIDKAGRLVIPKAIRERIGLRSGEPLEIEEDRGTILIRRPFRKVRLVRTRHGTLAARTDPPFPALDADDVREILEQTRDRTR